MWLVTWWILEYSTAFSSKFVVIPYSTLECWEHFLKGCHHKPFPFLWGHWPSSSILWNCPTACDLSGFLAGLYAGLYAVLLRTYALSGLIEITGSLLFTVNSQYEAWMVRMLYMRPMEAVQPCTYSCTLLSAPPKRRYLYFLSLYLRGPIASQFPITALVFLCLHLNLTSRLRFQGWVSASSCYLQGVVYHRTLLPTPNWCTLKFCTKISKQRKVPCSRFIYHCPPSFFLSYSLPMIEIQQDGKYNI